MYIHSRQITINKLSSYDKSEDVMYYLKKILKDSYEFHYLTGYDNLCKNSTYDIFDESRIEDELNKYIETNKHKSYINDIVLYYELFYYMTSMFDDMTSEVVKDDVCNMLKNNYYNKYNNIIEDNKDEFLNIDYSGDIYKFYIDNITFFNKYKEESNNYKLIQPNDKNNTGCFGYAYDNKDLAKLFNNQ